MTNSVTRILDESLDGTSHILQSSPKTAQARERPVSLTTFSTSEMSCWRTVQSRGRSCNGSSCTCRISAQPSTRCSRRTHRGSRRVRCNCLHPYRGVRCRRDGRRVAYRNLACRADQRQGLIRSKAARHIQRWFRRRREATRLVDADAEALIRDHGDEAYWEARRREHDVILPDGTTRHGRLALFVASVVIASPSRRRSRALCPAGSCAQSSGHFASRNCPRIISRSALSVSFQ